MYQTHTPAEWAEVLFLGTGVTSSGFVPVLLFSGARLTDFDPRPALARAGDRLLVETVNARYGARNAAVYLAALVMLLTAPVAAPKGATHA